MAKTKKGFRQQLFALWHSQGRYVADRNAMHTTPTGFRLGEREPFFLIWFEKTETLVHAFR